MKKEVIYVSPESRCVLLQVEGALCASLSKSFSTTDFDVISETDISADWL